MIKAPKLYFIDTGLASFLTKWNTPETLLNGAMSGAFFETFVVNEILKSYLFRGKRPPLYYYRDKEGHEIDLIIENNNILYPIEIKLSAKITDSDLKNINFLRGKISNMGKGVVVSPVQESIPIDRKNEVMPVSMIS